MKRPLLAAIAGVALMLAFAGSFVASTGAQEGGSLIIGVSQCPEGYEGTDFAADCVEPAVDVEFFIGTPNSGNVDSTLSRGDGLVTFALAPFDLNPEGSDTVNVGEPVTQGGDYAVSCMKNGEEPLDIVTETLPFEPGGPLFGITFDFDSGDEISCSWFRLSSAAGGEVEPPASDDPPIDVLPNTGTGEMAQRAGSSALLAAIGSIAFLAGAMITRRERVPARRA